VQKLEAYNFAEIFGVFPIIGNINDFTLFDKATIDCGVKPFRLIGGRNQKTVAAAINDFVENNI